MSTITLYHGTLRRNVRRILRKGLNPSGGWGGAGTSGVYLSGSKTGALYWAKMAFLISKDEKMEAERFDRVYGGFPSRHIAILRIDIPEEYESFLKADMEQAEDVRFEGDEDDWRESLIEIGDVRYDGAIPAEWISEVNL